MKCLDCGHSLSLNTKVKFKEWSCTHCHAKFVFETFFDHQITEYYKNKLKSDLSQAKVLSQNDCLICRKRMIKVLDFIKFNEVEACAKCKMIWLNGGELKKLLIDQATISQTSQKVKMPSEFEQHLNIQIGANDDYVTGSSSFGRFAAAVINNTYLSSFSNKYPILAWFLAIFLMTILFFIFIYFFRVFRLFDFFKIINRS